MRASNQNKRNNKTFVTQENSTLNNNTGATRDLKLRRPNGPGRVRPCNRSQSVFFDIGAAPRPIDPQSAHLGDNSWRTWWPMDDPYTDLYRYLLCRSKNIVCPIAPKSPLDPAIIDPSAPHGSIEHFLIRNFNFPKKLLNLEPDDPHTFWHVVLSPNLSYSGQS